MQSTILISNLHCSSCVKTIEEALSSLSPPPSNISTSIVSQTVVVDHSSDLSPKTIKRALDEAGFDLIGTPELESYSLRRSTSSLPVSNWLTRKREKHAEQCLLCQREQGYRPPSQLSDVASEQESGHVLRPSTSLDTNNDANSTTETHVDTSQAPPGKSLKTLEPGPFRAIFSVGGMTCAACTNSISHMVSELDGVSDVTVSLVNKAAMVILDNKDLVPTVAETIEDAGFECELATVEPVTPDAGQDDGIEIGPRTVSLSIEGMFCQHCPDKLMKALEPFQSQITILEPISSWQDPKAAIKLSYQPSSPDFTIRTIISALESSKSPPFKVSIVQPLSLEERARILHHAELRRLILRLLSCVIAAIPTFIIGIVFMSLVPSSNATRKFFMEPMWTGNTSRSQWAMFFLATPVMFYSAAHFHRRSLKEIRALWRPGSKTPIWKRFVRFGSMNLLVSLGVSIAYFASIALLALAASQPASSSGMGDTTTYFDSVVFLTMFLLCGRCLESYSKGRTADAITALGKLRPTDAYLVVSKDSEGTGPAFAESLGDAEKANLEPELKTSGGQHIRKINTILLEVGDVVRVLHGSTPPSDGIIITGDAGTFDESSLTGESKPIKKAPGDKVFVGTINKGQSVDIKVAAIGGETMLDKVVKVVREGQTKRAPIERIADVVTSYFVPVITLLAILTWIIWLVLGLSGALPADFLDIPIGGWPVWSLEFAIAVFVVACPCGVGLAAPTALLVGSGLAAKFGILVRGGGEAFQEAAQLDLVVFDKTGTLTQGGEPSVTNFDVTPAEKLDEPAILGYIDQLESASSHPLANALRKFCGDKHAESAAIPSSVQETAGRGLLGEFGDCTAVVGNEAWMNENGAATSPAQSDLLEQWKGEGKSVVLFAIRKNGGKTADKFAILAIFAIADQLRPEARGVVEALQRSGLTTWMISGDNEKTARAVAKNVGIPETNVIAGVLPHQKAEKVAWLQQVGMKRPPSRLTKLFGNKRLNERCIVAMVGDGINDAPALTTADVGIAIGSGSDVAMSSASFILVQSNLRSILTLTDLSRKVFNRVKFNFFWALIYNMIGLPVAAGVIYPAGHARLDPVWASLAMALSSVTVVLSSLLLRLYREPQVGKSTQ